MATSETDTIATLEAMHTQEVQASRVSEPPMDRKIRGFAARMMSIVNRLSLSNTFGTAFGMLRDYYAVFGWDRAVTPRQLWEMYYRGGIARRVAHAFPDAVWSRPPQLYSKTNPAWTDTWTAFAEKLDLWAMFHRFDVMGGMGQYAVLVIGSADGMLDTPLTTKISPSDILYLECYPERDVRIVNYIADGQDEKYGFPERYQIFPNQTQQQSVVNETAVTSMRPTFYVHHTRVIHLAKNAIESRIFGLPDFLPIWNYLTDLIKVIGASSESYWMTAYQGMHADLDKDLELTAEDRADLASEIDEYQHGQRRFIRTRGVTVKALGSTVANPMQTFNVLLTLIAGTTGIPQRVLAGSEAGHLASSQDRANWAERIEEYRSNHAQPHMIKALIEWLQTYTTMVIPADCKTLWPEAYRQSPLERGQTSAQTARTIANILKGIQPVTLTPEILPQFGADGLVVSPGAPATYGPALITMDEARKLIGLSTDQRYILEQPD